MAIRKKTAALVATGVGLTVVGAGVAASTAFADPTPTPPNSSSSGYPGGTGYGGKGSGQHRGTDTMATELATKLGLDQTKVSDALKAVRQDMRNQNENQQPGQRPDPATRDADLAKALAPKLGVDEAKIKTALDEIRTAHQAQRGQALKTKLDQAVKDGKLTQAEADAVQKAVDDGIIGRGGR